MSTESTKQLWLFGERASMNNKIIYRILLLVFCLYGCGGDGSNNIVPDLKWNLGTGEGSAGSPSPANIKATSGHGSITIAWTSAVSKNWLYLAEVPEITSRNYVSLPGGKAFYAYNFSNDGSMTIHCLSSSKEYYFVMTSEYRHGNFLYYYDTISHDSNVVSATPLAKISAPLEPLTGLQAISGINKVELLFNQPALNEDRQVHQTYKVYLASEPWLNWHDGLENSTALPGKSASYQNPMKLSVTGLDKNVEYHFAISSFCGDESSLTEPVSGTITSEIQWQELAEVNVMEPGSSGQSILGKIYLVGVDKDTQTPILNIYNPENDSWTIGIAPIEWQINAASAVIDNNLYIAGGRTKEGVTNTLSVYETDGPSWTIMAPMPSPLSRATMVNLNDKLVVLGGYDELGNVNQNIDIYDPDTDTWERKSIMLNNSFYVKAQVVGEKLMVVSPDDLWSENFFLFDIETGEKTFLAAFPEAIKGFNTAIVANSFYVVPADKDDGLYIYSIDKNSWERQSNRKKSLASDPVLAVISNELYVAGRLVIEIKGQGGLISRALGNGTSLEKTTLVKK